MGYRKAGEDNGVIETWPKTPGKILKYEVFDGGRTNDLTVEYEYFVKGTRYQSQNVYRSLQRYNLGYPYDLDKIEFLKNPEVKYNPQDPSDCCLLLWYNKTWFRILMLVVGILLSSIGWIGLLTKIFK